jgi:DNA (cytosine-5)-methyltransferase 1
MSYHPNFIDLFAGAGGLSEGFMRAGFAPLAHVEVDEAACNTLRTRTAYHYLKASGDNERYVSYLKGDISRTDLYATVPAELLASVVNLPVGNTYNSAIFKQINKQLNGRDVDVIVGGPPCQAYSLVGRARSKNRMKGDPRNYLYVQYARYLEKYQPKMFVFENVIGLMSANGGGYLVNMEKLFFKKGYRMQVFLVEADSFGVLQNRKRVIILGWHKDLNVTPPDISRIKINVDATVRNVLHDLPEIAAGEGLDKYLKYRARTNSYLTRSMIRNGLEVVTQHVARPHSAQDLQIYKIAVLKWQDGGERLHYNDLPERLKTHANRTTFCDRFKVVAPELSFSQTVVAHIAKDGHYYIHPDLQQNRSITVREAARLQSFPDDYYFEGVKDGDPTRKIFYNRTPAFRQIGNAVPPLMAQVIAQKIKACLSRYS